MQDQFNLAWMIGKNARQLGALPAIIAEDMTVDYREFWRITRSIAYKMRDLGVGQNSFVVVRTRVMLISLATLHATALLGARYSPYDAAFGNTALPPSDLVLYSSDSPPDQSVEAHRITQDWLDAATYDDENPDDHFDGFISSDSPWLLLTTSGTTGSEKFIWLTGRQAFLRAVASTDDFVFGRTRFAALFPCNSRPFFARANAALLSACAIVDTIDIGFLKTQNVSLFCASPRAALEWLAGRIIQPKLPLIQVSGARTEPTQVRLLLQSFDAVEDVYGATETSKTHVNRIEIVDGKVASCGRMLDSRVEIYDQAGTLVQEPGKPGIVRVSNPYMNFDYVGRADPQDKLITHEFFQSGDIAAWGPQKELLILGRVDQLMNLGGMKIDPGYVEAAIQRVTGVTGAAVMPIPRNMVPPQLMAIVTLSDRSKADLIIAEVRKHCEVSLPAAAVPTLILVVHDIPRTGDGSPKRMQCRELAERLLSEAEQMRQVSK